MLFNNMFHAGSSINALLLEGDAAFVQFGYASHFSGDDTRLAIMQRQGGATGDGMLHVYTMDGATPTLEQSIDMPSNSNNPIKVRVDGTGERIVVGASSASARGTLAGDAYVYKRTGTTWALEATLSPASNVTYDQFGFDVSISSGGDVVAVAHAGDDAGGGATVFTRSGTTWTRRTHLLPTGATPAANVGSRNCDVSPDGGTVVFGVHRDEQGGAGGSQGTLFVYKGSLGSWSLSQKIFASDAGNDDEFGIPVRFADDLSLVVCANEWDGTTYNNIGQLYIFERASTGASFTEEHRLTAPEFQNSTGYGVLGLDISGDGSTVIAGSVYVTHPDYTYSPGHMAKWVKSGASWSFDSIIVPPEPDDGTISQFGHWPAINSDGSVIVGGAPQSASATNLSAGRAYIFS